MDVRALLGAEELLRAVCADPRDDLAVATTFRKSYEPTLVSLALQQRELRARAAPRLRDAATLLLTRAGLEQATSTSVARHRAERFSGLGVVADVCCGIGGDSRELVAHCEVVGVDLDPVHLALARHNAGERLHPVRADAAALPLRGFDAVLIDPARREGGSRRRGHEECSPPLMTCFALTASVARVVVKAAPGLEHDVVPGGWSIEAVAIGRELKELALWSPAWEQPLRRATVIRDGGVETFEGSGARGLLPVRPVASYLLDPSPAITRAGLVQELGAELGAQMLDERIGFLTSDEPLHSPFVRTLRVLDVTPWNLKHARSRLRELGIGEVDLRLRGLALDDPAQIRRKLSGPGSSRATLVLTRLGESPTMIVCAG